MIPPTSLALKDCDENVIFKSDIISIIEDLEKELKNVVEKGEDLFVLEGRLPLIFTTDKTASILIRNSAGTLAQDNLQDSTNKKSIHHPYSVNHYIKKSNKPKRDIIPSYVNDNSNTESGNMSKMLQSVPASKVITQAKGFEKSNPPTESGMGSCSHSLASDRICPSCSKHVAKMNFCEKNKNVESNTNKKIKKDKLTKIKMSVQQTKILHSTKAEPLVPYNNKLTIIKKGNQYKIVKSKKNTNINDSLTCSIVKCYNVVYGEYEEFICMKMGDILLQSLSEFKYYILRWETAERLTCDEIKDMEKTLALQYYTTVLTEYSEKFKKLLLEIYHKIVINELFDQDFVDNREVLLQIWFIKIFTRVWTVAPEWYDYLNNVKIHVEVEFLSHGDLKFPYVDEMFNTPDFEQKCKKVLDIMHIFFNPEDSSKTSIKSMNSNSDTATFSKIIGLNKNKNGHKNTGKIKTPFNFDRTGITEKRSIYTKEDQNNTNASLNEGKKGREQISNRQPFYHPNSKKSCSRSQCNSQMENRLSSINDSCLKWLKEE